MLRIGPPISKHHNFMLRTGGHDSKQQKVLLRIRGLQFLSSNIPCLERVGPILSSKIHCLEFVAFNVQAEHVVLRIRLLPFQSNTSMLKASSSCLIQLF